MEKEMVVAECTSTNSKKFMTENGPMTRDKGRATQLTEKGNCDRRISALTKWKEK